jgi:hypothetical protein
MTNSKQAVAENFDTNMEAFVQAVRKGIPAETWAHAPGRLYDKVYTKSINTLIADQGRYMVERKTGIIYAIKSWNQHNPRRQFGTVSQVAQWDWSVFPATPLPGTQADKDHQAREATFSSSYKKRGRPVGVKNKKKVLSTN